MITLILYSLFNFSFKLDLNTRFVFSRDLDGDGKKEIIFLHPEKKLSIFSVSDTNVEPVLKGIQLSKEGVIIDFGNFYSELKGEEILIAKSSGIDIFKYDKNNVTLIKSFKFLNSPLYPRTKVLRKGKILYRNYLIFFYPDKGILIDKNENFDTIPLIIERGISTDEDKSIYEIPKKSPLKTSYILPFLFFTDINGDGKDDLIEYSRDSLFIFFKKGEKFSDLKNILIDLSFLRSKGENNILFPNVFVDDIDGDGKGDILLTKFGDIILGKKAIIYLFLNHNGNFKDTPDQIIISETTVPDFKILDLNNDGKMDIMTNITSFDIWKIIKLILLRKSEITYGFYLFKNGKFLNTPNFTKKFSITEEEGNVEIFDFDKDGFYDIVYFKKNEILIYKGQGEKGFSEKPYYSFKIRTSPRYILDDFNSDNKVDILFFKNKDKETDIWGFFQ